MRSDAWDEAQKLERVFHVAENVYGTTLKERRMRERKQRAFYAGMLEIIDVDPQTSIIDLCCGPDSLLLGFSNARLNPRGTRTAVDPLTFSDLDEKVYKAAGIERIIQPVEVVGPSLARHDECWLYNGLQHVINPSDVLRHATFTCNTLRIFEWVDEPTSAVHLHVITAEWLHSSLLSLGFKPVRVTEGRSALIGAWDQKFYAGVWTR